MDRWQAETGQRVDDMALIEALRSDAFYVGALGSGRNQTTRKHRLAEHFGLTAAELSQLHGPVGLALGAKTPAEVAVAIMAEIVQVRNTASATSAIQTSAACQATLPSFDTVFGLDAARTALAGPAKKLHPGVGLE